MESLVASADFWKGKKVFITGHTGFKGSWLSLWLQKLGVQVTGYSLQPPSTPSLFSIAEIDKELASIDGDILDYAHLLEAMQDSSPDIIIHMAAQSLVQYSYNHPIETFSTNIMGTINLLEAIRNTDSVRSAVVVTSDKCYENQEWMWGYRENERLGGKDPYSNSKACTELVTHSYIQSYFNNPDPARSIACATARAGNVIGGGDWAKNRLLADIYRAVENKTSLEIRHPEAIRPWQHVMEPLNGYLLLAENLYRNGSTYSGAWNFGPESGDEKTVKWVIDKANQQLGNRINIEIDSNRLMPESSILKLDSTKSRSMLGWSSKWNIDMAISKTVLWLSKYLDSENMKDVTCAQIDEYMAEQTGES